MSITEIIKNLTTTQKFLAFLVVTITSTITSLGTVYLKGSDCTEISEKYLTSIKNYNDLIEVTDKTQQNYVKAKNDILEIQKKMDEIMNIISNSQDKITFKVSEEKKAIPIQEIQSDTIEIVSSMTIPQIILKEKTTVLKNKLPSDAESLAKEILDITHNYDKE